MHQSQDVETQKQNDKAGFAPAVANCKHDARKLVGDSRLGKSSAGDHHQSCAGLPSGLKIWGKVALSMPCRASGRGNDLDACAGLHERARDLRPRTDALAQDQVQAGAPPAGAAATSETRRESQVKENALKADVAALCKMSHDQREKISSSLRAAYSKQVSASY